MKKILTIALLVSTTNITFADDQCLSPEEDFCSAANRTKEGHQAACQGISNSAQRVGELSRSAEELKSVVSEIIPAEGRHSQEIDTQYGDGISDFTFGYINSPTAQQQASLTQAISRMPEGTATPAQRTAIQQRITDSVQATDRFFEWIKNNQSSLRDIDSGQDAARALIAFNTAQQELFETSESSNNPALRKALVVAATQLSNHIDGSNQRDLQSQLQTLSEAQATFGSAVSDISGMVEAEATRIRDGDLGRHQSAIASWYAKSQDQSKSSMDRAMLLSQLTMLKASEIENATRQMRGKIDSAIKNSIMGKYIDQQIQNKLTACQRGQAPRAISLLKGIGMAATDLACNSRSQLQKREACAEFQRKLSRLSGESSSSSSDSARAVAPAAPRAPAGSPAGPAAPIERTQ